MHEIRHIIAPILKGFKQFILRGNVIDLSVGIIIGAAFNSVVSSLVSDVLTPFVSTIIRIPNFSELSFKIEGNTFRYGHFLNILISFVIEAAVIYFLIVAPMNALVSRYHRQPTIDPTTEKCPECLSEIPKRARRCAYCTTQLIK